MAHCGINSKAKALFNNYIKNGKQYVQIDDITQTLKPIMLLVSYKVLSWDLYCLLFI